MLIHLWQMQGCKFQSIWLTACQSLALNMDHLCSHSNFADFEIKYLSFPECYDNNFAIFCLPTLWSIINLTKISGLCLFWAPDATWKLHIKQAYFHFICPIIQQFTAAEVTKPTLSIPLYKKYYFKNECKGFIRFPNTRKHLKPRGRRSSGFIVFERLETFWNDFSKETIQNCAVLYFSHFSLKCLVCVICCIQLAFIVFVHELLF